MGLSINGSKPNKRCKQKESWSNRKNQIFVYASLSQEVENDFSFAFFSDSKHGGITGTSVVRQAVEELLNMVSSPLETQPHSGCFVGRGASLNRWLLQSYVERMH